jgi:hypothetical protein
MLEESKEISESHVFKTNKLYVIAGYTNYTSYKDMHPLKDVIKDEEDE